MSGLPGPDPEAVVRFKLHAGTEVEVRDSDGELVGRFYLDMHPRADKFKHAAMFQIRNGVRDRHLPAARTAAMASDPDRRSQPSAKSRCEPP